MTVYRDFDAKALGRRIKKRRKEIGIKTQKKLGEILGYEEDTIQKWESGGQSIKLDNIPLLCNALQCDIDYLLGNIDEATHVAADIVKLTNLSEKAAIVFKDIVDKFSPALSAILESESGAKLIEDICKYISFPDQDDYCMTVNTAEGEIVVPADPFYIAFFTDYLSDDPLKAWYMPDGLRFLFSRINTARIGTDILKDFSGTEEIYRLLEEEYPLIIQQDLTKVRSETSSGRLERLNEIAKNIEKTNSP